MFVASWVKAACATILLPAIAAAVIIVGPRKDDRRRERLSSLSSEHNLTIFDWILKSKSYFSYDAMVSAPIPFPTVLSAATRCEE